MALSQIEESYLTRLTNLEFPDEPAPELAQEQADMMLAAGPIKNASDAGNGMGEIKAIPQNGFQEAIGKLGELLQAGAEKIDFNVVGLPGVGSLTLKDLTVGDLGKVLQDISYGFYPVRGGNGATGGIGTFGLNPDASMELLNAAPTAGAVVKATAKGAAKAASKVADIADKAANIKPSMPTTKAATR